MPDLFLGRHGIGPIDFSLYSTSIPALDRSWHKAPGASVKYVPAGRDPALLRVPVELVRGGRLALPGTGAPALDSGEGWKLYRAEEGGIEIVMNPPRFERPLWKARLEEGHVTVSCDDAMAVAGGAMDGAYADPLCYPLDLLLSMHALATQRRGMIVHAAGVHFDGLGAVIFPGHSGAGKSTLSRLMGAGSLLSDDRILVDVGGDPIVAWGTPWAGTAGIASAEFAPLRALCFPVKAAKVALSPLTRSESFDRLMETVSIPWYDEDLASAVLGMAGGLLEQIPAYALQFSLGQDVSDILIKGLPRVGRAG